MRVRCFATSVALTVTTAVGAVAYGSDITATGDPVAVDLRAAGVMGVVDTAKIRFSPKWIDANASVRIEAVSGGVTNVIKTGGSGEEGLLSWSCPEGGGPVYKLLMWTLSDGTVIGEPLTRTVSFGIESEGRIAAVDTCADSLKTAVASGGKVMLAYSAAWKEDTSSVEIGAIQLSGKSGPEIGTNVVFSALANAEGLTELCGIGPGYWTLVCLAKDSSGETLLEYQTDVFKRRCGFMLRIR